MEHFGVTSVHEEPSAWCHPIAIAPKRDSDKLRICPDFTHLNKLIQRIFYLSNSPFEAVTSIPAEELKYFCKFDARHGYWQIPLHSESPSLTCFITSFGRYVCNWATFGMNSISEWYNHCMVNFSLKITQIMESLHFLQNNSCHLWLPEQEQAFNKAKCCLSPPPVLTYF